MPSPVGNGVLCVGVTDLGVLAFPVMIHLLFPRQEMVACVSPLSCTRHGRVTLRLVFHAKRCAWWRAHQLGHRTQLGTHQPCCVAAHRGAAGQSWASLSLSWLICKMVLHHDASHTDVSGVLTVYRLRALSLSTGYLGREP